jgi:uncharacterized protein (TIGR00369 family)
MQNVNNKDFAKVQSNFARQKLMLLLGATLENVSAGEATVLLPFRENLTQQHGTLHAGVITSVLDCACGYAAYSLMAEDLSVVSVEFKVNLLAPAVGKEFRARAKVIRSGKTLSVCTAELWADSVSPQQKLVAIMQATMMGVKREEV